MSRQARTDTAPEIAVRQLLHRDGYRYRVNLPVPQMRRRTIDIAFTRAKIAVFLDGCFWHGCPSHATSPKANADWWRSKLERNAVRDVETTQHLESLGWTVLRFWEHESPSSIQATIEEVVESKRH
ncbi:very short patch repair endonuclease [Streptacidiphilus jiangxiensis]|uniref:very short patch repair endonuclease n=1 Tax=Streptacidiphilus jiangxiensis TaxID=235985 RepID=UPI000943DB22|nr:very short patch repair endonuclease [Streptacidiphilus jiangxiensis]